MSFVAMTQEFLATTAQQADPLQRKKTATRKQSIRYEVAASSLSPAQIAMMGRKMEVGISRLINEEALEVLTFT